MSVISVAFWVILKKWGNIEVARVPYNRRIEADELLNEMNNLALEDKEKEYYLQLSKIPITNLPAKVIDIGVEERKIRGFTEKKDGERRMWTKVFRDVHITTQVETGYVLNEMYTSHMYRGELRVVGHGVLSEFQKYAERRWPEEYQDIVARLEIL